MSRTKYETEQLTYLDGLWSGGASRNKSGTQMRRTIADVAGVDVVEPVDELSAEVDGFLGTVALPLLALRRHLRGRL